jgi:PPK2 family polyphosphate:nucleotide phosphotransferase
MVSATNTNMNKLIDTLRFDGSQKFSINKAETKIKNIYTDEADYQAQLVQNAVEIDKWQTRLYSHNRYGMLAVFQAMDAAGKDGTIQHVFRGTNPLGLTVSAFKRPTTTEIEHDFLWRTYRQLPERGNIGVFNRSYYEEVLVVKVHPDILLKGQQLPIDRTDDLKKVWKRRYEAICNMEKHLHQEGFLTVKFFLNVSKEEQAKRLIERITDPAKNWKFDEQDVKERAHWNDYMAAFEDVINETATDYAPWYVVPADDKKTTRLLVGQILIDELKKLPIAEPVPNPTRFAELQKLISVIENQ